MVALAAFLGPLVLALFGDRPGRAVAGSIVIST